MRILYLDCGMGAAGDMLMSALLELVPDKDKFVEKINNIGISNVKVKLESSVKCGIKGNHVRVLINDEEELSEDVHNSDELHHHNHTHIHHHAHYHATIDFIEHTIQNLAVSDKVKNDVISIYKLIAQAESKAHGVDVSEIHFHEVGTLDALADVCGCALLMYLITPEKVFASPLHVGSGFVKCAHGILPVPAPATAELLKGIPFYTGSIKGELLTPTGAAILRHYVEGFEEMPIMTLEHIGYGMGQKDFETANCVRTFLGDVQANGYDDKILSISCNLDDMTGEDISFAAETLLNAGALDVYTIPIQMKKGRPGIILTCLCPLSEKENFTNLFFQHTTTRGIRYAVYERVKLVSTFETKETPYGKIRIKKSSGYHVNHEKPEFEDLKAIAFKQGCSLKDVRNLLD